MVKKIVNGSLYGKRKLLVFAGIVILLSGLLLLSWLMMLLIEKPNPIILRFNNVFESLMETLLWLYFGANTISKFAGRKNGK